MEQLTLVADSGSTKTAWKIIDTSGEQEERFSHGFNPYLHSAKEILDFIAPAFPQSVENKQIKSVFLYGAGCSNEINCQKVEEALNTLFPHAEIEVEHDLLAAARGSCGNNPGAVAILGTGCNSCFYDGQGITENVPSLGYLLGDEGSGNQLGKKLIKSCLMNELSTTLEKKFLEQFEIEKETLLHQLYNHPKPNALMAQFAPFIKENLHEPEILKMATDAFTEFVNGHLLKYPRIKEEKIHFVGSIGWHFKPLILQVLKSHGLQGGQFLPNPLEGLVQFHLQQLTQK